MVLQKGAGITRDRTGQQWRCCRENGSKKPLIHKIRKRQLKFGDEILRKIGLENLTVNRHVDIKRENGQQMITTYI